MPRPCGPLAWRRQGGWRPSLDSQHSPRLGLADLPNEAVVIKMQQGRSGDKADQNVSHRFHRNSRVDEAKRPVGHDQANINADERATAPEDEPHEATDARIPLDACPIIDPDNREVLHIVEHLKKRDAYEDILDAVITVPP